MKRLSTLFTLACILFLTGCAAFGPPPAPGATDEEVLVRYGNPTAIYPDGDTILWEYAGGYWSQQTHMAHIGSDNRLISWEQVRTDEKFGTLTPGKSDKANVLKTVGQPTETSRIHLNNYEVWSYRYKQDGVWDSMMHVMFDDSGILQRMEVGPDPLNDDRGFIGRGRGRSGVGVGIGGGGGRGGGWGGIGIGIGF